MASMQMNLINCLASRQRKQQYGGRNEIVSAQNGVIGQFYRLYQNTRTKKHFFKNQIHERDPA